jgi:hypothetical protein
LIRVGELVSSGISTGWVGVFSGGLVAKKCPSKNEIRSILLVGDDCFGYFIGVLLIYGVFVL